MLTALCGKEEIAAASIFSLPLTLSYLWPLSHIDSLVAARIEEAGILDVEQAAIFMPASAPVHWSRRATQAKVGFGHRSVVARLAHLSSEPPSMQPDHHEKETEAYGVPG